MLVRLSSSSETFTFCCPLIITWSNEVLDLVFVLVFVFSSPDGVDGQPPALPPKQLSRKTLSQIIQAHSQQSLLDNHVNEMYDVPVNADKTTVGVKIPDVTAHALNEFLHVVTMTDICACFRGTQSRGQATIRGHRALLGGSINFNFNMFFSLKVTFLFS